MRVKWRRDTAANWEAANPILADGEVGYDKTNRMFKVGNGTTRWVSLNYLFNKTVAQWQALWAHFTKTDNPHNTTATQIGAVALNGVAPAYRFRERIQLAEITVGAPVFTMDPSLGHTLHVSLVADGTIQLPEPPTHACALTVSVIQNGVSGKTLGFLGGVNGLFWPGGAPVDVSPDNGTVTVFTFLSLPTGGYSTGANADAAVTRWYAFVGGKDFR